MAEASKSTDSSCKTPWSRKQQLLLKVAAMNEAKRRRANTEEEESSPSLEPAAGSAWKAPLMDQDDLVSENSDHDDSGSEKEAEFDGERAQVIFDDWIVSLSAVILRELQELPENEGERCCSRGWLYSRF